MIIELANVGMVAKKIELEFEPSEIDLDGEDATLTGKAVFGGEAQQIDGKVHVRGTVIADVSIDCTRCLESVAKRIEVSFDDIFVDLSEEPDADEIEVSTSELDESLVLDGKIDIAEVVREQILLALPDQVFCREDCKGLCPKCGANRNLIDCKCADDEVDPRWAALKNLR